MGSREVHNVERDVKVLEGSSDRHSARLEGQYLGIFPAMEVPSATGKGRKGRRKAREVLIEDPLLLIDLDATDIEHDENFLHLLLELVGLHPQKADFKVISVIEKVLRALAKAKFRNLAELRFGDELVYDHPEREYDLKEVLGNMKGLLLSGKEVEEAKARVIDGPEGGLSAEITVDRIRTRFTHDIRIEFHGKLEEELMNRIVNYLERNLSIEELLER